jgi:NAD(P)-dependent dehydrogenase (short-subunit alcohol dehydrogenase family)
VVDALDEAAVERHADAVLAEAGSIDVSVNAVGVDNGDQGVPLVDLSPAQFTAPIEAYTRTAFLTSRAAARRMTGRGGVILTVSVPMARTPTALAGCFGAAFAAVENFTRQLAAEVGPHGVRVVGLRPTGMPGTVALGSHTAQVWGRAAERLGLPLDQLLEAVAAGSPLQRALTVEDVAETAVFVASSRAGGLTSTVVNVSGGAISD